MLKKTIKILDKIVEVSIYCLIFIIPFSKAGIEIFATISIVGWVIKKGLAKKFFPQTPLNQPVFALFVVSFVSMIFSVNINLGLEGVFLKLGEYILLFFICADIFSKKENNGVWLKILLGVIVTSTMVLFADAGFQWITGKDFIRGFSRGRFRACFCSANDFAGYLIATLPILFCMIFILFKKIKVTLRLTIRFACIGLFLAGLILLGRTFTRGAWLGYLISMLFMGIIGLIANVRKRFFAAMAIICFLIPLIVAFAFVKPIGGRLASVQEGFGASATRLYQWKEALAIIEDFPLLGTGPNTYTVVACNYEKAGKTGYYPHNSYLHMVAEIGILGLLAFLWILWRFFKGGLVILRHLPGNNDVFLLGIMGGILATLVHSFVDTNLFALKLVVLFWVMLGIGTSRIIYLTHSTQIDKAYI